MNLDDEEGTAIPKVIATILLLLAILAAVLIERCRRRATLSDQGSSVNMNRQKGQICTSAASRRAARRRSSIRSRRNSQLAASMPAARAMIQEVNVVVCDPDG